MEKELEKAFQEACRVRENAYCPHSGFQVGACLKVKGEDKWYGGCNVENGSYGGTVCAERVAVLSAVADMGGSPEFEYLVLVAQKEELVVPCGMCLQVLSEFCGPEFPIYLGDTGGIKEKVLLKELMPRVFKL